MSESPPTRPHSFLVRKPVTLHNGVVVLGQVCLVFGRVTGARVIREEVTTRHSRDS